MYRWLKMSVKNKKSKAFHAILTINRTPCYEQFTYSASDSF